MTYAAEVFTQAPVLNSHTTKESFVYSATDITITNTTELKMDQDQAVSKLGTPQAIKVLGETISEKSTARETWPPDLHCGILNMI